MPPLQHPASFRDPSGFVFFEDGQPYRFVAHSYSDEYRQLMDSGLYDKLVSGGKVVSHEELNPAGTSFPDAWKILKPVKIASWSYAYEWSFHQLKEAALLTLDLNLTALEKGMILKDAPASNIQFYEGRAVLIDSLSFERYVPGEPWKAFRQFCQHFLYPLLLGRYNSAYRPEWLQLYPDGIPAASAAALLPAKPKYSLFGYLYVSLPARAAAKEAANPRKLPANAVRNNLLYLRQKIGKMELPDADSHWSRYYGETVLHQVYLEHKLKVIENWFQQYPPGTVTDIGCNTGAFSLLAAKYADRVIAFDNDAASIDRLFLTAKNEGTTNLLPLVASISQPTPGGGWENRERSPLLDRVGSDTVMALALVHHLALTESISFECIFALFAKLSGKQLIVEFIPKNDPMAQLLLKNKPDLFPDYHESAFQQAAGRYFDLVWKTPLQDTSRVLYCYRKKTDESRR